MEIKWKEENKQGKWRGKEERRENGKRENRDNKERGEDGGRENNEITWKGENKQEKYPHFFRRSTSMVSIALPSLASILFLWPPCSFTSFSRPCDRRLSAGGKEEVRLSLVRRGEAKLG